MEVMTVFKDSASLQFSRIFFQIGAQNHVSRSILFRTYYESDIRLIFFLILYF
ncbi:unnamed protein product [Acanthoscelides obtectus]|uniref:Uncharacterized protein n=1 Tax=Acanthoscelides obtectus TaxID=200917 RepID=A0A9P0JXL7_ACAOB|nr:unnamed protein product [Acanthoscelides obtectus]CAK1623762.1 hypothetical protein AOBTE_LOCUS2162 [Acanthoscelides obtectus]